MKLGQSLLVGIGIGIIMNETNELMERRQVFQQARLYADAVRKPLLVVGTPKQVAWFHHPGGDVTIDIDPNIDSAVPYQIMDVRNMSFSDKQFGASFISHVLEHLNSIDDASKAIAELRRVSDKVFVAIPHKTSLLAWLHPRHHLWVLPTGDGYIIEDRHLDITAAIVTGVGRHYG